MQVHLKRSLGKRYTITLLRQDCLFSGYLLLIFPATWAWTLNSIVITQYVFPQFYGFVCLFCSSVINQILHSISDWWSEHSSYFFYQFYILDVRFVPNCMPCKRNKIAQWRHFRVKNHKLLAKLSWDWDLQNQLSRTWVSLSKESEKLTLLLVLGTELLPTAQFCKTQFCLVKLII